MFAGIGIFNTDNYHTLSKLGILIIKSKKMIYKNVLVLNVINYYDIQTHFTLNSILYKIVCTVQRFYFLL